MARVRLDPARDSRHRRLLTPAPHLLVHGMEDGSGVVHGEHGAPSPSDGGQQQAWHMEAVATLHSDWRRAARTGDVVVA